MKTQFDISNLPVNRRKCVTCPFGNAEHSLEAKVIERCLTQQASQICRSTEGPNCEPR